MKRFVLVPANPHSLLLTFLIGTFLSVSTCGADSIHIEGSSFKDDKGRTLMLRGVDLGGSSKLPTNLTSDARAVTFVGRPFALSQADEHFRRLRSWGLTVERLLVPWEAIEHAGPGQYDQAYLDFLHELVRRAGVYGIKVYIDPHQDAWSRALGGDGVPYWAMQAVGLTVDRQAETGAPQTYEHGETGYWPPSSSRHGEATMETLFWAGDDFAPGLKVDGEPVQGFLQSHYILAIAQVATRLRDLNNVIGYDVWNEPTSGYIGTQNLDSPELMMMIVGKFAAPSARPPTNWEYIQAASGFDPGNNSVVKSNLLWATNVPDIWRRFGVWDVVDGKPTLLKPDYFAFVRGKPAAFNSYLKAFELRYIDAIRQVAPTALIFQELNILGGPTRTQGMTLGVSGVVNEPHFYDTGVLLSKRYKPDVTSDLGGKTYIGRDAILDYYTESLDEAKEEGEKLGGIPTLLGEVGLRFNINEGEAFRSGDFSAQEAHASILFDSLDRTLMSYSIWNYTADNSNVRGDGWRGEDLSIFSPSQRNNPSDINSGGRALRQIVRPYPIATAGSPKSLKFDSKTGTFEYHYVADSQVKANTEVFIPLLQYPKGIEVSVQGGSYHIDLKNSRVEISNGKGEVSVRISPKQ